MSLTGSTLHLYRNALHFKALPLQQPLLNGCCNHAKGVTRMAHLRRLAVSWLCTLTVVLLASACGVPAEPLLQRNEQSGAATPATQATDGASEDLSREDIAALGRELALQAAPQVASDVSSRYWFDLPGTVPWWGPEPVTYAEGGNSQGALRLRFHRQNIPSQGFLGDELALLWQAGAAEGGPDAAFAWAGRAGVSVADSYELLPDGCMIDGHACQLYLHRGRPNTGDILWRIWYDDQAELTYALVASAQEPEVGLAFEKEFRGKRD